MPCHDAMPSCLTVYTNILWYFPILGCFCVYNSAHGLDYVQDSLEKTLLSELHDDRLPFQGLPVVIVLAHDPAHTERQLQALRDRGQALADR